MNNAAAPAPPRTPTANTIMAIAALADRRNLLGTLDMASSLVTIRVNSPQGIRVSPAGQRRRPQRKAKSRESPRV
jgi:hypothetical protein